MNHGIPFNFDACVYIYEDDSGIKINIFYGFCICRAGLSVVVQKMDEANLNERYVKFTVKYEN